MAPRIKPQTALEILGESQESWNRKVAHGQTPFDTLTQEERCGNKTSSIMETLIADERARQTSREGVTAVKKLVGGTLLLGPVGFVVGGLWAATNIKRWWKD